MERYKRNFQEHVLKEDISSADMDAIESWAQDNRLSVFTGSVKHETNKGRVTLDAGPDGHILSLRTTISYRDGEAAVLLSYNPNSALRFASWVVSLLLSFDVFLLLLYFMLRKKLDYILRIEQGICILESGRLDHKIPVDGADELAKLALGLNQMSRSFQARVDSEQRVLAANRQIIGDLSHDIRTPLTVGMGYLALLLENEALSESERKEYLTLVQKKAGQIEERTRMLLEFSTLTSGQLPVRKSAIDARTLITQLKEELSALAELLASDEIPAGTVINGDPNLLERLSDNLLSNLKVHGDMSCAVYFRSYLKDECVHIEIENTANANKELSAEKSSLLGLKICASILELHKGVLKITATEGKFLVKFSIPASFLRKDFGEVSGFQERNKKIF